MLHHKVKQEKAKEGKRKLGKEREGERTPGKPLRRERQRLHEETKQAKATESKGW